MQAGFATSRTLGCAQVGVCHVPNVRVRSGRPGFVTSRTLGCAQVGFATSWTLGFGIDFGFIMALNTVAIDLNTLNT